jgi:signal transduction histidine kinase
MGSYVHDFIRMYALNCVIRSIDVTESASRGCDEQWPAVERRKQGWVTDWQSAVERDKATLARSLHDNTGGLLVAAVMDIAWAQIHLPDAPMEVKERLVRARAALDVAVDLNRRMIEDLRPTLLDNFGLIAALKWHFAEACKSANIIFEQHLPEPSPIFSPHAAIALYRISQTLLAVMVSQHAHAVRMGLTVESEFVTLKMCCEGLPDDFTRQDDATADALASITGRVKALGGDMQFDAPQGAAVISCRIPANMALSG